MNYVCFMFRCWISLSLSSWITLSTWPGTPPFWVHIIWMSMSGFGQSTTQQPGELNAHPLHFFSHSNTQNHTFDAFRHTCNHLFLPLNCRMENLNHLILTVFKKETCSLQANKHCNIKRILHFFTDICANKLTQKTIILLHWKHPQNVL